MDLMNAAQAAAYLGIKRPTLYAYVSRGLLKSVPHGTDVRRRGYRRSDLDRLKRRRDAHAGHAAAAAAALEWGAPSLETVLSQITAAGPAYRGRPLAEFVRAEDPYEAVAELLWTGTMAPRAGWVEHAPAPLDVRRALPGNAGPLEVLRAAVLLGGLEDAARFGATEVAQLDVARRLIVGATRTLAAWCGQEYGRCHTVAELVAAAFGAEHSRPVHRAINAALVIMADHELNASTFAARVAASTGADLYACVGAALATFTGPRHGGACDRCAALLREIAACGSVRAALVARVRRGESPPGFGHPLYPDGDPRFHLLRSLVTTGTHAALGEELVAVAAEMELGAPASDLGLALLARALGLPDEAAVTCFAVGRMAGWIAHALEQRRQGFLLRPRARYVTEGARSS